MRWKLVHPRATFEMLGYLPDFLSEDDTRSAKEQIADNYRHGGGWRSSPSDFKFDIETRKLTYPGDPPDAFPLIAETRLRDEKIFFFGGGSWLLILQKDGTYEMSRVD